MSSIKINGIDRDTTALDPQMPLLWYLRDVLGFTGTKFGCGVSQCGACTVLVGTDAIRSCITKIQDVGGPVTTIEGIGASQLHPVQKAWIEGQVAQCGYCQSGQIMLAASLLAQNPNPTAEEIDGYMSANICRCGTYNEIRTAVKRAVEIAAGG